MRIMIFSVIILVSCGKAKKSEDGGDSPVVNCDPDCNQQNIEQQNTEQQNIEQQNTGTLALDLDGMSALAIVEQGQGLHLVEGESNLMAVKPTGDLTSAWKEGSASVKKFLISPTGDIYLIFAESVPFTEENGGMSLTEDAEKRCILASVDRKGKVSCVDSQLQDINMGINNEPVQFNSAGELFFAGHTFDGKNILRRKGKETKDLISADNVSLNDFVAHDSGVFIQGTSNTGAQWFRKVNEKGSLSAIQPYYSHEFVRRFPDNNIYFGASRQVYRYSTSTSTVDPNPWIDGDQINPEQEGMQALYSSGGAQGVNAADFRFTSNGSVFAVVSGTLYKYYPEIEYKKVESLHKIQVIYAVGNDLYLAGVTSDGKNKLIAYNTADGKETDLIPDEEVEIYQLAFRASSEKQILMASGLRFSNNTDVLIQIELGVNKVSVTETDVKLSSMLGLDE